MGLLKIIRKIKAKEREMRVLVLGLDNAGKTTVLKRLKGEDTSTISPTVGFNIETLEEGPFKVTFWDVGGQKSLRAFWRNYFESTDGVIWVVDSADEARLEECAQELQTLLQEERLSGCPLLVLCNKQDVKGALDVESVQKVLKTEQLLKSRHVHVVATDAKSGNGLREGVQWIIDDISARLFV